MVNFNEIEAIIFDLDGTLIDSMWIWKQIDIDFLARRGIEFPEDFQKEIEGMSFTETAAYFMKRFDLKEPMEDIKSEWHDMAVDFYRNRIPLKEKARDLMDKALEKGIKIGIGTSNSKELLLTVLDAHDIQSYFHTLRTSCEVASGKPSPDIFLKVAEDLGVSPEKCLVFEDTYAGVMAGKSAGMKVIAVYDEVSATSSEEIKKAADAYIQGFNEIMDDIF